MKYAVSTKVLVYHPRQADEYAENLRKLGVWVKVVKDNDDFQDGLAQGASVLFAWRFPWAWIPETSPLCWIQLMGAGADDIIQQKHVMQRQVVTRILDQFGEPIAQYVFAWILYLQQGIGKLIHAQQEHEWEPFLVDPLHGKTLAVAGLGSIGQEIIKRGRAFSMPVIGLSKTGRGSDCVDRHFTPDNWGNFVAEADYLVLTLPLTSETHHVIRREILDNMKRDAVLINVGRGKLIDERDLLAMMQTNPIRAAVLDVFETEPLPVDHPLWGVRGVYATPHMSGVSRIPEVCSFFMDNLRRFEAAQSLIGVVDPLSMY